MPLYHTPDLRTQTIDDARAHIEAKRVHRMVQLNSYQEQLSAKLHTLRGKELDKFKRQADRVQKNLEHIETAIAKAQSALNKLAELNTGITNIENEIGNL